jgi:hypothetical protein
MIASKPDLFWLQNETTRRWSNTFVKSSRELTFKIFVEGQPYFLQQGTATLQ